mmetsp:Transcript_5713/g.6194  ORF Transcript_5713/g.6194 Transcript_5713/m.6194 type:complete len:691 (-) Transcript_5713:467-2539(-)
MRVAIIGSGVTGLAAASHLHKHGCDVVVYEASDHVGGHAHTQYVNGIPVDTGFMVLNRVTYPNLLKWFKESGVLLENSEMSFSVSLSDANIEWSSDAPFASASSYYSPNFYGMLYDITRFKRDATQFVENKEPDTTTTMEQFLQKHGYGYYFIHYYLVPMMAAIWSCDTGDTLKFPALFLLKFFYNHHLLQVSGRPLWLTVKGRCADGYVSKVTAPFADKIHVNNPVKEVYATSTGKVKVVANDEDEFDRVVFANHAPDVLKILKDVLPEEQDILSKFKYQENDVWLHHDTSLMPKNPAAWACWNFIGNSDLGCCVTYWLKRLQNIESNDQPIFVTLNPSTPPKAELVVNHWKASHPVPSLHTINSDDLFSKIQGKRNMWFAGAYQGNGFHEDGFKSGMAAANDLLQGPWKPLPNNVMHPIGMVDSMCRNVVLSYLKSTISSGTLEVHDIGHGVTTMGDGKEPKAILTVMRPQFYSKMCWRSALGLADAFIAGDVLCDDLCILFELIVNNRKKKEGAIAPSLMTSILGQLTAYWTHQSRNNSVNNTRQNIHEHYDLGNDFFKLFLDKSMSYSCGIFNKPDESLYDSQMNKVNRLIELACVKPGDRVLEIGFGWGTMSIELAKLGCKVTGLTLSSEQKKYAEQRAKEMGVADNISFELVDYRQYVPEQKFDRIVSCEMLEAVGHDYLPDFF